MATPVSQKKPRQKWVKEVVTVSDIGPLAGLMAKGTMKQLLIREKKTKDGATVYRVTVF